MAINAKRQVADAAARAAAKAVNSRRSPSNKFITICRDIELREGMKPHIERT
jgi:hypothetical protein